MNENMIPEEKIDLLEASKESAAKLSEAAGALAKTIEAIAEYVPTVWVDNSEPDIDAEKLNHIEEGIKSATEAVNSAIGSIAQLNSDLVDVRQGVAIIDSKLNYHFQEVSGAPDSNPVQGIKDAWPNLPNGTFVLDLIRGPVYTVIVQRVNNGDYGMALILSYNEDNPIYIKKLLNNWTEKRLQTI